MEHGAIGKPFGKEDFTFLYYFSHHGSLKT
jgi:hypothetical protein